jgi:hypothetical protein
MLDWLAIDSRNTDRFLRSLDKIINGRIVLILEDDFAITSFRLFKKNRKVKR